MKNIDRRSFLRNSSLAVSAGVVAACGGGGSGDSGDADNRSPYIPPTTGTPPTSPKSRVIVVGGGMAGATVSKYLRLWGDQIDVTLIDREPQYTSNILSSLVLTGQRTLSSLQYGYETLRSTYGLNIVNSEVTSVDPVALKVSLSNGSMLSADRIVMAPGIDFDDVPGLSNLNSMPHAWKAGTQTTELAQQLAAMPTNGIFILAIPLAPYRCPPGPYERACLIADWMRVNKPQGKLIILDANPNILVEPENFRAAFTQLYGNIIEYRAGVAVDSVEESTKTLFTSAGAIRGDVINLIPRQKAPQIIRSTGLITESASRFAPVDMLDYASTSYPKVHIIGDSSATTQPKAGHIANQEAKVCADAIIRYFGGLSADPAPVTTSACFSTITMSQASWLHGMFEYNPSTRAMTPIPAAAGASNGWSASNYRDMLIWFNSLMADTYA
jgi:NADH dehydrogenase FAD-containing subunit